MGVTLGDIDADIMAGVGRGVAWGWKFDANIRWL